MSSQADAAALTEAGWVSSTAAAKRLGVTVHHVGWLARKDHLPSARFLGRQRWVLADEVEAHRAEQTRWVSYVVAAQTIGCSTTTVGALVRAGHITKRGGEIPWRASLDHQAVERVAQLRAAAAAEREARRQARSRSAPPQGPVAAAP